MSVPVPHGPGEAWRLLGKARYGEGNRPWSAGAGGTVLATGLAQGAWMLRQLSAAVPGLAATTQPGPWQRQAAPLLLAKHSFPQPAGLCLCRQVRMLPMRLRPGAHSSSSWTIRELSSPACTAHRRARSICWRQRHRGPQGPGIVA
jgi:hypothetical protein